jgi:hypothetical protein
MMRKAAAVPFVLLASCAEPSDAPEYGFQPIEVGSAEGAREPRPKTSSQFLRSVYADLLGRAPESYEFVASVSGDEVFRLPLDEEALLTGALDGVSDTRPLRSLLVTALLSSEQVTLPEKSEVDDVEGHIAEQFRRVLGREPSSYELASFAGAFRSDEHVTPRSLVQALLDSREYQSF